MKYLFLLALFACEGPIGPAGEDGQSVTDTLFVSGERVTKWLFPASVINTDASGNAMVIHTFGVSFDEYEVRRGSRPYIYRNTDGIYAWHEATVLKPVDQFTNPLDGKLRLRIVAPNTGEYDWKYYSFEWDE